ncbi:MAG TPA: lipid A biosynthesis acyltransferase [Anaeromyxobacter sp.]|nr:lipid A biosynthesis acyltransferase [Anaeromyxobacter sp.]
MSRNRWKRTRRAARAAVIRAGVWLASLLPLRLAMVAGGAIARLGWPLSARLRRDMRASLAVAFPDRSPAERDAIAIASLVHLGRLGGELVTMRRWAPRLEEYVAASPETVATVKGAAARGKGIIFAMGHIGNWELTSRLARYVQPCYAIAKRSWHPSIDALTERFRAENGVGTLFRSDSDTGRRMLKLLRRGGTLGILIDQDIDDVQSIPVPFFGRPARTPRAAADLALRFGAALLVVTSHRRGPRAGDGHVIEVVEVPHDPSAPDLEAEVTRLTAACAAAQEAAIRRHPAEWVWMHQRWKGAVEAAPDRAA